MLKELEELKEKMENGENVDFAEALNKMLQRLSEPGKIKITIEGLNGKDYPGGDEIKEGTLVREGVGEFFLIAKDNEYTCVLTHCGKSLRAVAIAELIEGMSK